VHELMTHEDAGARSSADARFDYPGNRRLAGTYSHHHSAFWPPAEDYVISTLDLEAATPDLGDDFRRQLAVLRSVIEREWLRAKKSHGSATEFGEPDAVTEALCSLGEFMATEGDRKALMLRAGAIEDGYSEADLEALKSVLEVVTIVAGHISTWYGKHLGGMPTAFGCCSDDARQSLVAMALARKEDVSAYLGSLYADLRLNDVPAFAPTQLFFMAGEGNLHPKHIAYFLPSDEGVRSSPFKKTYYFVNTHQKLLRDQSTALADRFLDVGVGFDAADQQSSEIPTLGVFGHELGHSVFRPATSYKELNELDRWASVVLQEVAADVFGVLILTEVWAEQFDYEPAAAIAYYLAECLRYANRGLGHFPDSDGMYLQLSYLVDLGALALQRDRGVRLTGDPSTILAGLRSLARVLADTLLSGSGKPALELYEMFGPGSPDRLQPLVAELSDEPTRSIEYVQEHLERDPQASPAGVR
jgi:hypothetical protein